MSLKQDNDKKINDRFTSVMLLKNLKLKRMMSDVLSKAMEHALSLHDGIHVSHTLYENTYGWVLVHDGIVEEMKVNGGEKGYGNADSKLLNVVSLIPDNGWYGVVLAQMNDYSNQHEAKKARSQYYVVSFENNVLLDTAQFTAQEFDKHFKKLTVTR